MDAAARIMLAQRGDILLDYMNLLLLLYWGQQAQVVSARLWLTKHRYQFAKEGSVLMVNVRNLSFTRSRVITKRKPIIIYLAVLLRVCAYGLARSPITSCPFQ